MSRAHGGPTSVAGHVTVGSAAQSLRRYLLLGIMLPIVGFVAFDTVSLYRSALASINTAYDRSLLASAKSIGELMRIHGGKLSVDLPLTALEMFDVGNSGRMYYRIAGFQGEFVAGYQDLPVYVGTLPQRSEYAALVDFYDTVYQGEPVRMAALVQPVASVDDRGLALVQVAETLDVRERLARRLLVDTLLRQLMLVSVVVLVTWVVVARALRPLERLRRDVMSRDERDLSAVRSDDLPAELQPVVLATNDLIQRLGRMMGRQRQFVRDASHQLRTPLAVLRMQVRNAMDAARGDPQRSAGMAEWQSVAQTVERAIRLTEQMLALAKVDQVDSEVQPLRSDLAEVAREVALDLAPLISERDADFELVAPAPVWVPAHAWMLRELLRNLLSNAVRETPPGAGLVVQVTQAPGLAEVLVRDHGPGLAAEVQAHLFEPFHTGHPASGTGLGLTICREICQRLGGRIELQERRARGGRVEGVDARVSLPLHQEAP